MECLSIVMACQTVTDWWTMDMSTLVGGGDREKSTWLIVLTQLRKIITLAE